MRSGGFFISGFGGGWDPFAIMGFPSVGGRSFRDSVFSLTNAAAGFPMFSTGRGLLDHPMGGGSIWGPWSTIFNMVMGLMKGIDGKGSGGGSSSGSGGGSGGVKRGDEKKSENTTKTENKAKKKEKDKKPEKTPEQREKDEVDKQNRAERRQTKKRLDKLRKNAKERLNAKGYLNKSEQDAILKLAMKGINKDDPEPGDDTKFDNRLKTLKSKYGKNKQIRDNWRTDYAEWAAPLLGVSQPRRAMIDTGIAKVTGWDTKKKKKVNADWARIDEAGSAKDKDGAVYERFMVRTTSQNGVLAAYASKFIVRKHDGTKYVWGELNKDNKFVEFKRQPKEFNHGDGLLNFTKGKDVKLKLKADNTLSIEVINARLESWKPYKTSGKPYLKLSAETVRDKLIRFFGKLNGKRITKVEIDGHSVNVTVEDGKDDHDTGRRFAFLQRRVYDSQAQFDQIAQSMAMGVMIKINGEVIGRAQASNDAMRVLGQNAIRVLGPIAIKHATDPNKKFTASKADEKRAAQLITDRIKKTPEIDRDDSPLAQYMKKFVIKLQFAKQPDPGLIAKLKKTYEQRFKKVCKVSDFELVIKVEVVGNRRPLTSIPPAKRAILNSALSHAYLVKDKGSYLDAGAWEDAGEVSKARDRLLKGSSTAFPAKNIDEAIKAARQKLYRTAKAMRREIIEKIQKLSGLKGWKGRRAKRKLKGYKSTYETWYSSAKPHLIALIGKDEADKFELKYIEKHMIPPKAPKNKNRGGHGNPGRNGRCPAGKVPIAGVCK